MLRGHTDTMLNLAGVVVADVIALLVVVVVVVVVVVAVVVVVVVVVSSRVTRGRWRAALPGSQGRPCTCQKDWPSPMLLTSGRWPAALPSSQRPIESVRKIGQAQCC